MGIAAPLIGAVGAVAGVVGAGASLLGGVTSAEAAQEQGQAQSQMYTYQSKIAEQNTAIAEQNARVAAEAGETQALNVGLKESSQIGEMKATMGARGVDVNSGSNALSLEGAHQIAATDISTVRSNAAQQVYGYETTAANSSAQAGLDLTAANQSKIAGGLGAQSALLSGVSSLGANWSRFQMGANFNNVGAFANSGLSGFIGTA